MIVINLYSTIDKQRPIAFPFTLENRHCIGNFTVRSGGRTVSIMIWSGNWHCRLKVKLHFNRHLFTLLSLSLFLCLFSLPIFLLSILANFSYKPITRCELDPAWGIYNPSQCISSHGSYYTLEASITLLYAYVSLLSLIWSLASSQKSKESNNQKQNALSFFHVAWLNGCTLETLCPLTRDRIPFSSVLFSLFFLFIASCSTPPTRTEQEEKHRQ